MNIKKLTEELNGDDVISALAQYLDTGVENIEEVDWDYYGLRQFRVKDGEYAEQEYAVATDSDEIFNACKEEIESLIDDIGVMDSLNWDNMGGIENFLEEDWFRQAWEEMNDNYVRDIIYEGNGRFKDELTERGFNPEDYGYNEEDDSFEDEEGAIEVFKDSMMKDLEDSGLIEEFVAQLGKENLDYAVQHGAKLDIDKVTQEVMDVDGAGHILATYDGNENEEYYNDRWYYIYRLN